MIKNVNAMMNGTIMTNAVVKKINTKAGKPAVVMSYKVKDAMDGEIREVSEFRKLESADAAVKKAQYYTVGRKVSIAVSGISEEVRDNKIYRGLFGFGTLINEK